jgi:hypothetical protein
MGGADGEEGMGVLDGKDGPDGRRGEAEVEIGKKTTLQRRLCDGQSRRWQVVLQ